MGFEAGVIRGALNQLNPVFLHLARISGHSWNFVQVWDYYPSDFRNLS